MPVKLKRKYLPGMSILAVLCIISGFFLYFMMEIPFGIIFQTASYIFCISLALLLILVSIICFKSKYYLVKLIGFLSAVMVSIVIALSIILLIDYRILYFRSLPPNPDKAEWIEDLHYLADKMVQKHANLYALISEEIMAESVRQIQARLQGMDDKLIPMEFFRLAALPNDCHTFPFIMMPAFDLHSFPLKVYYFPEGLHVVDAGRDYKDLIGARILKIGSMDVEDIFNKFPLFLAAENTFSYKERFTYMVMMAEWLLYHDIIQETDQAEFTFIRSNKDKVILTIPSVKFYQHFLWSGYFPVKNEAAPVFTNPREDYYNYKLLEDNKTLYIQFNQSMDQPGRETAAEFTARLRKEIDSIDLERCIVDLRNNDGGSPVWDSLLQFLKAHEKFNRHGALFVLIGRRTFSSAVIFATRLQLQTNAILVGEPTGQGPVFYSGPDLIDLPHSRLPFSISRRLTVAGLPFDPRKAVYPDLPVEYMLSDFLAGSDPVLQTALKYISPSRPVDYLSEKLLNKYTGRYLMSATRIMDISNENNILNLHLSDYRESSGFQFQSELYPVSDSEFNTRLKGVKIEFPTNFSGRPDSVFLNWMGVNHTLKPVSAHYVSAFELFSKGEIKKGCELLSVQKDIYLAEYPDLEFIINRLGYFHLRNEDIAAALQLFRLNVEMFPESYNVYDSYGESLMVNGQIELAIQNYNKSLDLNPDNKNAEKVIKRLMPK